MVANEIFKERFSALLKERNMTQREVANVTNLTESAVSHYMKGDREPKGAILLNIANALGTTTDYLSGRTNEVKSENAYNEVNQAYQLIARNAKNMTAEDKARFAKVLFSEV